MNISKTTKAFALATALFTTTFSGSGLQVMALGAGGVMMMAGEAMAQNTIPGVGVIIKKNPGGGAIVKGVSDDNGEVAFKLEAGDYSVTVGDNKQQDFTIAKGQSGIKVVVTGTKEEYVGHVTLLR
jgi:hypothetical protein